MSSGVSAGTLLVCVGLGIALLGASVWLLERFGIHLGHLPLDLRFRGSHGELRLPLGSSILVSVILTILANWLLRR